MISVADYHRFQCAINTYWQGQEISRCAYRFHIGDFGSLVHSAHGPNQCTEIIRTASYYRHIQQIDSKEDAET
jgi:hypothetical protein